MRVLFKKHFYSKTIVIGDKQNSLDLSKMLITDSKRAYLILNIYFGKDVKSYISKMDTTNVDIIIITGTFTHSFLLEKLLIFKGNPKIIYKTSSDDILKMHSHSYPLADELYFQRINKVNILYTFSKRLFDILFSIILLLLTFPVLIMISFLIKIEDGGSVLFKQQREGFKGKKFTILKFRSMEEKQNEDLLDKQSLHNDPRVTKIGKILRATRVDELPQLINVLIGNMSFVGPRPLMINDIKNALIENEYFILRDFMKPGITGLQQINTFHNSSWNERTKYDLYYLQNRNFFFDIIVIIKTISVIFNKDSGLGYDYSKSFTDLINDKKLKYVELETEYLLEIEDDFL